MTIAELEDTLPNGFHDSHLVSVALDFSAGTCRIELDVDYDNPDPDVFRRMRLDLKGLSFFAVEPPASQASLPFGDTVWVSGYDTSEKMLPSLESYRKNAPAGSFFYSFFLYDSNCFIHLAAKEAALEKV
jgi:hypothetical protein